MSVQGVMKVKADDINQSTCSSESIEPTILFKSSDVTNKINSYDVNFNGTQPTIIVPMQVSVAGNVFMEIPNDTREEDLYITMYSDMECTKEIRGSNDLEINDNSCVQLYQISLPGTYYVKFELFSPEDFVDNLTYHITFSIMPMDVILDSGINYLGLQSKGMLPQEHKIVVTEPGFIKVSLSWPIPTTQSYSELSFGKSNTTIPARWCFEIGKESLDKTHYNSDYYFVVEKGTYYLKPEIPVGQYDITYTFSAKADKGGSSYKKAPTLKLDGKAVNGKCTGTINRGKSDWYRIKLSKDQEIKITLVCMYGKDVNAVLCDSSGKPLLYGSYTYSQDDSCIFTTLKKFKKGTYYIKLYNEVKNSYGVYSISAK